MLYVVAALVAAVLVLWMLWRRAAGIASRAQDAVAAMEKVAEVSIEAQAAHREVLQERESELRELREAHSEASGEVQAAAKVIHETGGDPEMVAGLWNKTFSGEE